MVREGQDGEGVDGATTPPQGDRWHLPALPTTHELRSFANAQDDNTTLRLNARKRLVLHTQARREEKGPHRHHPKRPQPLPRATARVPSPHPHPSRPYKDTEQ